MSMKILILSQHLLLIIVLCWINHPSIVFDLQGTPNLWDSKRLSVEATNSDDQLFNSSLNFSKPSPPSPNLDIFDDPEDWNQLVTSVPASPAHFAMPERLRKASISDIIDVMNTQDGSLFPLESRKSSGSTTEAIQTVLDFTESHFNSETHTGVSMTDMHGSDDLDSGFSESPQHSPFSSEDTPSSPNYLNSFQPPVDKPVFLPMGIQYNLSGSYVSSKPTVKVKEPLLHQGVLNEGSLSNKACCENSKLLQLATESSNKSKINLADATSLLTSKEEAVIMVLGDDETVKYMSTSRQKLERFLASSISHCDENTETNAMPHITDIPFTAENVTVSTSENTCYSNETSQKLPYTTRRPREEVPNFTTNSATNLLECPGAHISLKERRGRKRIHQTDRSELERGAGKRIRNNEACRKFRELHKVSLKNLFQQESHLLQQNLNLKEHVSMLKRQITHLKQKMKIK